MVSSSSSGRLNFFVCLPQRGTAERTDYSAHARRSGLKRFTAAWVTAQRVVAFCTHGICKTRKLWHRSQMFPALRATLTAATTLAVVAFVAGSAAAADRIRLAVQRTGTLAWELDVIKAHGLDRKARSANRSRRARIDRSRQDRTQGRLRRCHAVGLAVGGARALARRRAGLLSVVEHARRRHGAGAVADPGDRRSQGQEARHRGRAARQELAPAAGAGAPIRHRSQETGDDRLRRAAAVGGKDVAGRDGRDADVLELLRRARKQRVQTRSRAWTRS